MRVTHSEFSTSFWMTHSEFILSTSFWINEFRMSRIQNDVLRMNLKFWMTHSEFVLSTSFWMNKFRMSRPEWRALNELIILNDSFWIHSEPVILNEWIQNESSRRTAQNESRILNDSFLIQHVILSSFWAHHSEWISLNDSFRMSQSEWRAHKEWVMTHSEWVMTHSEWVNSEWVIQTDVLWRARSILNDGLRMNSEWRAFRMESFRLNESLRLTCSQWIQNSKWLIQNSFWARHSEWLFLNSFIQNEVLRMHMNMHSPSFLRMHINMHSPSFRRMHIYVHSHSSNAYLCAFSFLFRHGARRICMRTFRVMSE